MKKTNNNKIILFIKWWIQGLSYLLPKGIRSLLVNTSEHINIKLDNDRHIIRHVRANDKRHVDEREFQNNDEIKKIAILTWLKDLQKDRTVTLLYNLKENEVLKKTITLPLAAKNTVRQVLGFEMDRSTPFKQEDVYFDYILHDDVDERNELQVELYVAKRDVIDSIVRTSSDWQISLDAITIEGNDIDNDINLLPLEKRTQGNPTRHYLTTILILLCCILGFSIFYMPILQQEKEIGSIETALTKYRKEVLIVQNLKNEKNILIENSQYLVKKYSSSPPAIIQLNELAKILPDNTWVSRLIIKDNEMQLQGESDNATGLIRLLESSPIFKSARFRSPTIINKNTQKERFQLIVSINDGNTS